MNVRDEVERQLAEIRAGAERIYGEDALADRLRAALEGGPPLRVKLGVDPSAPDLHLGHTVVLNKLRRFQRLGHIPIFLIGDFTARIGDPSGRKKTRPALDVATVQANAGTYLDQVRKILDVGHAEIRYNSEWMEPMCAADLVRLCSHSTVARLLERDDFSKRMAGAEPIAVHEFLYPFVQAYDSVALRADVEIGGTDQTFNLLMAREIQRDYGQAPQAVVVHPLLVGTDGRDKMSKSLQNTIAVAELPKEMFGQIMSIADAQMAPYVDLLLWGEADDQDGLRTRVAAAAAGTEPAMGVKLDIATALVAQYHSEVDAIAARESFRREIQRGEAPQELVERKVSLGVASSIDLFSLLADLGLVRSRGEARRLIAQGGAQVDGRRADAGGERLVPGRYVVRAGRRKFALVVIEP